VLSVAGCRGDLCGVVTRKDQRATASRCSVGLWRWLTDKESREGKWVETRAKSLGSLGIWR